MQKSLVLGAILLLLGPLMAAPVSAQSGAQTDTSTTISLAGQVVMRIRTGAGGYTAAQRALAVRHRLIPILSLPHLVPRDVTVENVSPRQSNILVRGHLLLTVDQTLAQANGESPAQLAQSWAANLRHALPQSSVAHSSAYHGGQL